MTKMPTKPKRERDVPISYKPLRILLVKRDITLTDLSREYGLFAIGSVTKLKNNKPVSMDVIARICQFFDVPIEEVVEILPKESADS